MIAINKSHKFLHLYGFAFLGGISLSLVELAEMVKHNPGDIDLWFFAGTFLAGGFALIAMALFGDDSSNKKASYFIGFSSPQLIGGLIKGGTIATSAKAATVLLSLLVPAPYAGGLSDSVMPDTNEIIITIKGTHEDVIIIDEETDEEYTVTYEEPLIIPRSGKYRIKSKNSPGKVVEVNDSHCVDSTKQLNIIFVKKKKTLSILRGLFSGQHKSHGALTQKIQVQQSNVYCPMEDSTADTLNTSEEKK